MTVDRASPIGWGAFLLAGTLAAMAGQGWALGFAAIAILMLGLPHGASDLAVVAPDRRLSFLAAYLVCIGAMTLLWLTDAGLALGALLALSAMHFACDGPRERGMARNAALGAFLVGGAAVFHEHAISQLFMEATGNATQSAFLALTLWVAGLVATTVLAIGISADVQTVRTRWAEVAAMAAVLAFPPLVGFTIGFVLLHARGQTMTRQAVLACPSLRAYLMRVAPVMAGAVIVLSGVTAAMLQGGGGGATFLFAGIAALATPHMLVTPLWRRTPPLVDAPHGVRMATVR